MDQFLGNYVTADQAPELVSQLITKVEPPFANTPHNLRDLILIIDSK